jgi:hypothetical protein
MAKAGKRTYATEIIEVPYKLLVPAPWNYKPEAPRDLMERLAASIKRDRSAGVLAVRERPHGRYEVMDGNHRLEVLGPGWLNWDLVRVENFGAISHAEAILIAHRRNHQWVEPDYTQLSRLFSQKVLKDLPVDDVLGIIPETAKQFEGLLALGRFDWSSLPDGDSARRGENYIFSVAATAELLAAWEAWEVIAREQYGCEDKGAALLKALQTATESSKKKKG